MIKRIKYHLGFLSLVKWGNDYYVTYTSWWERKFVYRYNSESHSTVFQREASHSSLGSAIETRDLWLKQRTAKRINSKVTVL